jgi:hypothetical protein
VDELSRLMRLASYLQAEKWSDPPTDDATDY